MINVHEFERRVNTSSSPLIAPSSDIDEENEDHLSFLHTLFTCRQQQRRKRKKKKKKKGKTLNLSSVSTFSLSNPRLSRRRETKEYLNHYQDNDPQIPITTSEKTAAWQQNDGGFHRAVLTHDNTDGDDGERVTRSSSSTAAAADRRIQRQRRKQTRLKRKSGSEKRREKREKERNKKSLSSSIEAEATEASLFQFVTLNTTPRTSFYPNEQAKCAEKNTRKKENCFPIQTSGEHQQQQKQEVHH